MHQKWFQHAAAFLLSMALLFTTGCRAPASGGRPDPDQPISLSLWHYYQGPQVEVLNQLVNEFNETKGAEQGITVEAFNRGTVDEIAQKVMDGAKGKTGAEPPPDIFTAYADTAYAVDRQGLLADLTPYFSQEELASYVPGYIEEGRIGGDALKIFPVAKSTEIMLLNRTDWDKFAQANGFTYDSLETIEDVVETARRYYEWTDSLTPQPDDGRALFGRDAVSNYLLVGSMQLGQELFQMQDGKCELILDRGTMRILWDNYYTPMVNGWFAAGGGFRSDDLKTGTILSMVGSVSGAAYCPDKVSVNDTESYPMEAIVLPAPRFRDGGAFAVQQGAGMAVVKSDSAREHACAAFLKWFTETQRNLQFAAAAGYMPVKTEANGEDAIQALLPKETVEKPVVKQAILMGMKTVRENSMYTCPAFPGSMEVRTCLEKNLSGLASQDAAEVQKRVDSGESRAKAAAEYTTEEHFEQWLTGFEGELTAILQRASEE